MGPGPDPAVVLIIPVALLGLGLYSTIAPKRPLMHVIAGLFVIPAVFLVYGLFFRGFQAVWFLGYFALWYVYYAVAIKEIPKRNSRGDIDERVTQS